MRVRGAGPTPCEICIVGEGPGFEDDRHGRLFTGRVGEELDRFLDGIDLPARDQIFLTNIFREYQGKDYVWTQEDLARDEPELLKELQIACPKVIITLGRWATRYFLGDIDMEGTWGYPWILTETEKLRFLSGTVVFPIHHPSAGLYNSEMNPYVVAGFQRLADYLDGDTEPRVLYDDPFAGKEHYEEITNIQTLDAITRDWSHTTSVALDTEGWPGLPWSLQFSDKPGAAYLIRAGASDLLRRFTRCAVGRGVRLIYHSALHDLGMGRALQCEELTTLPFDDTMVMAYLLQIEPQGLKPGCLRTCNMKMSDYTDIMGDASNALAREYLTWIWDGEQATYEAKCESEFIRLTTTSYTDAKGKIHAGRRLKVHPKLPKSALHKATSRVLQSKRPAELWKDQIEDLQVASYHALGPLPTATLDYVSPTVAIPYGCRDADGTLRLRDQYRRRINEMGLSDVYELELTTYPLLDRMQRVGLKPDLAHFADLSAVLGYEVGLLQSRLCESTGNPTFNANSGDQVAAYLFSSLGLEEMKLTSSGRGSTNDKILEALEHEHPEYPVISTIRAYRETYKLKHTFVDRIPDFVSRWPFDGRVHATFRTTRVVTGRLAASDPNLLAQPEHGAFADHFKRGWVADDGHMVCAWDESQIELRGLAHLSQDRVLLEAFRGGIDLHATLAQRIFGIEPKLQDKHKHRLPAKAINFGIPMGMTCKGLSVELRKNGVDADEDTAQRWLDDTLNLYTGVKTYMVERVAEARQRGYIRCLSGRIRYIGGIRSRNERIQAEAERFAFSTPIQESAQFIMKQAESLVWTDVLPYFWKRGHWVEPLIQIHDCLKMECEEGLEQELHLLMTEAMTNVPRGFTVPLAVEGEYGYNFADVRRFK